MSVCDAWVWQAELNELDAEMALEREKLSRAKSQSERAREEVEVLKGQRGFVNNRQLVADFEGRRRRMDDLRDQIEVLKEKHRRLTLGPASN